MLNQTVRTYQCFYGRGFMQALIAKSLLKSLKPAEKPYEVRDTRTRGLLLRIQPSGG